MAAGGGGGERAGKFGIIIRYGFLLGCFRRLFLAAFK